MKERKNAELAYKSAMDKLKMPAQIDLDKKIISNGSGKIRMKSRWLAYAAAAAVLALCIGIGAMVLSEKDVESAPKIGSTPSMTLEKDQTIPSGEITSMEQAVKEHQKCLLLENDEYIKLKANRDNITDVIAKRFSERTRQIDKRNGECISYIAAHADFSEPLFLHGVLCDDGYMDLSYNIGRIKDQKSAALLTRQNKYYLCDAKTGDKLIDLNVRYSNEYEEEYHPYDCRAAYVKLEKDQLEKLGGELSLIAENKDDPNEKITVLKSFRFFDKYFIGYDERDELESKTKKVTHKDFRNASDGDITITAENFVCAPHGITVRLTLRGASDTGKELIKEHVANIETDNTIMLDRQDIIVGSDGYHYSYDLNDKLVTWDDEHIVYDCYIPLHKLPPEEIYFTIKAEIQHPDLSADEIANGEWKGITVGSVRLKYKPELTERFYCSDSGNTIRLCDMYFTLSKSVEDDTELTLKNSDGSETKITIADLTEFCKGEYYSDKEQKTKHYYLSESKSNDLRIMGVYDPNTRSGSEVYDYDDHVGVIFFEPKKDTSKVTSIVYAGEEYKLKGENSELAKPDTRFENAEKAKKTFDEAYKNQLGVLEVYKTEISKHTADKQTFAKQMCELYDSYDQTLKKAGKIIAAENNGECLHAGKTTAGELVFSMWYDESFPTDFAVANECIISTDKDAKTVILKGRTMHEFMASPQIAQERGVLLVLAADLSGTDLTKLKAGQTYYITFNDINYSANAKHITKSFSVASDKTELSMDERFVKILPQMRAAAYSSDESANSAS